MQSSPFSTPDVPLSLSMGLRPQNTKPRGHTFQVVHGVPVERKRVTPKVVPSEEAFADTLSAKKTAKLMQTGSFSPIATGTSGFGDTQATRGGEYEKYRKVLRFYAFFKEAVVESPTENYRVRNVTILYYLEDDTLQINEPVVDNSALPQGTFVKRHKAPHASGKRNVHWSDLQVGETFTLYGRVFRITDADASTRDFYEAQGMPQPEPMDMPADPTATLRATQKLKSVRKNGDEFHGKKANPMKRFMEASLGNASAVQIRGVVDKKAQFLELDRKVLRFYGLWDERDKDYGDRRTFRVQYFLADDEIEVLENWDPNAGRDRFPALIRKQPMPRKIMYQDDRSRGVENDNGDEDYYHWTDLGVGFRINLLGRDVLLYDADESTYQWYEDQLGIDMRGDAIDISEPIPEPPKMELPPPMGYGDEEDSLQSFRYLIPKPPKRDMRKLVENAGKVYRFQARFANPSRLDENRRFIIVWYTADDQLMVYEPLLRNSGVMPGRFCGKGKYKNPATGENFKLEDLSLGGDVEINSFKFRILDADLYTKKAMGMA